MSTRRITPWYRSAGSSFPFLASILVPIDARYIPLSLRDLEAWKSPALWTDGADYTEAYDALCKQGASLLMDIGAKLQMEIRALRGVDDLQPGYNDPDADPFNLSLGTVEENKRQLETLNARVEEIRLLVEAIAQGETLEEIKGHAAQIALLLA